MNLKQIKASTLQLLDRYSVNGIVAGSLDTADLNNRMNFLANSSQFEISRIKKIKSSKTITQTGVDEEGYKSYSLPSDFFELRYIRFGDSPFLDFMIEENKLKLPKTHDGSFYIHYNRNPEEINDTTPDDYELEIDQNSQSLIPIYIASRLLMLENRAVSETLYNEYLFRIRNLPRDESYGISTVIDVMGW